MMRAFDIVATSSVTARDYIGVDTLLRHVQPRKPRTGELVTADDVWRMFGMRRLSHFTDPETGLRLTPEQGGKTDSDLAVESAQLAMKKAGLAVEALNTPATAIVHLTCTPSRANLCNSLGDIKYRLGLNNAHAETHNLGCAAVAYGFHQVEMLLGSLRRSYKYVLLIATNVVEGPVVGHPEVYRRVREHRDREAWFSALFASAGSCLLFAARDSQKPSGLIASAYETKNIELVDYPGGGSANFVLAENVDDQAYLMHAAVVGREFVQCLKNAMAMLQRDWPTKIEPVIGGGFSVERVVRWYFHQPNLWKIYEAADALGIPRHKVPTLVENAGNLTAASTPILYHEDLEKGLVKPGDIVVFLLAGAGLGEMYGYGLVVVS